MLRLRQYAIVAVCATACALSAQNDAAFVRSSNPGQKDQVVVRAEPRQTLTADDGLSILAAALDSRPRVRSENDCSHLAHAIYQRAGFPYTYASSSDLFDGIVSFERVSHAQPGDLIVWRGHVGIVVKPSRHIFFSLMSSGPGIDDWESSYWRARGHARFYRYVKNPAARDLVLSSRRPRQLVQVSR
jgi:cell wall-associated NlpC family hydrolase